MKKLVVLTGAGMSAESGIATFRDSNGLWEGHDVMKVASPQGFKENPALVLQFYNDRRRQLLQCKPNIGHHILAQLETTFNVQIITQNVDDLHERAGSKNVLHLHGELLKARSTGPNQKSMHWTKDISQADKCPEGFALRPDIVWFGELVPAMDEAIKYCQNADVFVVVGTSLVVYPAAGLVNYVKHNISKYIIDPNIPFLNETTFVTIQKGASEGLQIFQNLINEI